MPTEIEWRGIEEIERNLNFVSDHIHQKCLLVAAYFAPIVESEARSNAIWTDRTGNARQGLTGLVNDMSNTMVELYLTHKMSYGKWLEIANSGRYAIILPTLETNYDKIFKMLEQVLK